MFFSVVIPIYNVGRFISEGLKCVIEQSFTDFEVILVDDGSSDGSGALCDAAAIKYDNVRVIHQANAGAGPSRNAGIKAAKGDYIYFFDIDDYLHRDALSIMHRYLVETHAQILVFSYREIDKYTGRKADYTFASASYGSNDSIKDAFVGTLCSVNFNNGFVWNKVYDRNFLIESEIEFEPLRIQQDEVFNLAAYKRVERLSVVPDVLYDYYVYSDGNTRSGYIPERLDIYRRVRDAFIELAVHWGLESKVLEEYVNRRFIDSVLIHLNYNLHHHSNGLSGRNQKESIKAVLGATDIVCAATKLLSYGDRHGGMFYHLYLRTLKSSSYPLYAAVHALDEIVAKAKFHLRELIRK